MSARDSGIPSRQALRVEFRPLREADEALYRGLYTDSETMAHIAPPLSAEQAVRSFRKALRSPAGGPQAFAVIEKANGTAIGLCGWQQPDPVLRHVQVGVMLRADARNQRYSIEAIAAIIDLALATLPVDIVWVQYSPANLAVERLCDRLGMQYLDGCAVGNISRTVTLRMALRSNWTLA